MKLAALAVIIAASAAACGDDMPPDRSPGLALHDEIFASKDDHGILCAGNADDHGYRLPSVLGALDRAARDGTIVQLFMHDPGARVSPATIEAVLAAAQERGLRFVTYRELAAGVTEGPGRALGFDDWFLQAWTDQRPLFAAYGARLTFFVALYPTYDATARAQLAQLAADGHDIEFHSTNHLDAVGFVKEQGLDAYLDAEVDVGLDAMRADGYDPVVFAYPAGLRTPELDEALLQRFAALRATTLHCPHLHE